MPAEQFFDTITILLNRFTKEIFIILNKYIYLYI